MNVKTKFKGMKLSLSKMVQCWWHFANWEWLYGLSRNKRVSQTIFCDERYGKVKIFFWDWSCLSKAWFLLLSQRKYTLDLLQETGMLECKPASTPMKANVNSWCDNSHILDDPGQYRRLIGKLIYLTVSRPAFTVGVLSMHQPKVHWTAALRIFAYTKSSPGKGLLSVF